MTISHLPTEIHSLTEMEGFKEVQETHEFVKNLPDPSHFMEESNEENLDRMFDWISKFPVQCYGTKYLKKKVKVNKGTTMLDWITASDMAYAESVMEDNMDYWEHLLKIGELGKEEKSKFIKKNQVHMSEDEVKKYAAPS